MSDHVGRNTSSHTKQRNASPFSVWLASLAYLPNSNILSRHRKMEDHRQARVLAINSAAIELLHVEKLADARLHSQYEESLLAGLRKIRRSVSKIAEQQVIDRLAEALARLQTNRERKCCRSFKTLLMH